MAAKLLRFLWELLNCRNGQLLVIGTMRSDHWDVYEQSRSALRAPYFRLWRLGPFPPERIEEVIRKPMQRAKAKITDEMVERLNRDTPTAEALSTQTLVFVHLLSEAQVENWRVPLIAGPRRGSHAQPEQSHHASGRCRQTASRCEPRSRGTSLNAADFDASAAVFVA
jgi:hypothetical protein